MIIRIGNRFSYIEREPRDYTERVCPIKFCSDIFKYKLPNAERTTAFKRGWDGYIRLITKKGRFSTGLLPKVIEECCYTFNIDLIDERINVFEFKDIDTTGLYEYQAPVVDTFVNNEQHIYFPNGIFDGATNSGKTYITASLVKSAKAAGATILLLIHDESLLNQHVSLFESMGIDVSIITAKKYEQGQFTIAMKKTLLNRAKKSVNVKRWLKTINFLIVDECHLAGAKDYQALIKMTSPYANLFVSGTALDRDKKHENMQIISLSGNVISTVTNKQMIESEFSTPIKVEFYKNKAFSHYKNNRDKYTDIYIKSKDRLKVLKKCLKRYNKILIPIKYIEHGDYLSKKFPEIHTLYADTEDRDQVIEDFRSGKIKALASTVIKEGLNIKGIDCAFNAVGGKSKIFIKQVLAGRILRKSDDVEVATIIDFIDSSKPKLSAARKNIYEKEGFKVKIN